MKKFYALFILLFPCFYISANDSITISNKKYRIEMLEHRHEIGTGTFFYGYRLPDFPLEVFMIEVDTQNPYIKFEACLSKDSTLNLETVQSMAERKTYAGHEVIGGINGDFFGSTSCNGSMCQGDIGLIPNSFGPMLGFDLENLPFMDDMRFAGSVSHNGNTVAIDDINTTRGEDKLILYNCLNGQTTKTNIYGTEVVLSVVEEDGLVANKDIRCIVEEVYKGVGNVSLNSGKIVLSGHQAKATYLNDFEVGDEVTLHQGISLLNYSETLPYFTDMLGSNCVFLKDGEKMPFTSTDGSPNADNPRTAAGFSADKSKMYFCVVDGRSDFSRGVKTIELADIMAYAGASTAMNFDGGGSSVLLVKGEAGNKPAQMPLRPVANAFLVVSTAPEDKKIDYIKINCDKLNISYGSTANLSVSTFNQYGNVINYKDLKGVEYEVVGDIGDINADGTFLAYGSDQSGYIKATYQNFTHTIPVNLTPIKEIRFSLESFVADHLNSYQTSVLATDVNGVEYKLEKNVLIFQSLDEKIVQVDEFGKVIGVKKGVGEIKVITLDGIFENTCEVTVQIGTGELVLDDFTEGWTVTSTDYISRYQLGRSIPDGFSDLMLEVNYEMTYQNRTAFIELQKEISIYGIPEALEVNMISNGRLSTLTVGLSNLTGTNGVFLFEKFTDSSLNPYLCEIPYENYVQSDYPLTLRRIRLTVERDNTTYENGEKYTGSFYLKDIKVIYEDKTPNSIKIFDNPQQRAFIYPTVSSGVFYLNDLSDIFHLKVYNIDGSCVFSFKPSQDEMDLSFLISGIYICEVITLQKEFFKTKILLTK